MAHIWKYSALDKVSMPAGAQILDAQLQDGAPVLWALVDPHARREERELLLFMTGAELPRGVDLQYVATLQNGGSVGHIFEKIER